MIKHITGFALFFTLLGGLYTVAAAETTPLRQATFAVHCYDVGAHALQNRDGVIDIDRGWLGGEEVDRVRFDPERVTLEQLEERLKAAGTYRRTVEVKTIETNRMEE